MLASLPSLLYNGPLKICGHLPMAGDRSLARCMSPEHCANQQQLKQFLQESLRSGFSVVATTLAAVFAQVLFNFNLISGESSA
jgi:hypothetical protein